MRSGSDQLIGKSVGTKFWPSSLLRFLRIVQSPFHLCTGGHHQPLGQRMWLRGPHSNVFKDVSSTHRSRVRAPGYFPIVSGNIVL